MYESLTYWLFFYIKSFRNFQIFLIKLFHFKLDFEMADLPDKIDPSIFPIQDELNTFERSTVFDLSPFDMCE